MQDRKKQRITLKQYIHSNSLRKQALSRANSRQSSLCAPSSPARHTLNFHQKQASTKEGLLKQIKIKLAEFIDQDQTLVDVLKMIDRVIELYNQEIKQNRQQIQVLNSVIKQHQIQVAPKHLNRSDNQSRILIEGNSQEVPSQFSMSFHPTRTQHQLLTATNNSNKQRWLQDSHNTSEQKDEIPNIRLLLQTRNKQTQQVSEKLKETLENKNILYPEPNESVIESFGLDKTNSQRRRRSSGTSNCSNHLDPAKFFNHEQEPSQIRFSVRSSLWNNHFEGLSMRKTCQPDKSEL